MTLLEAIMLAADILGTFAFALAGALVAIDRELDLFGVVIMACTTSCGGGIMRDMMIGKHPPAIFTDYWYILIIATVVAIVAFTVIWRIKDRYRALRPRIDTIINVFDAIGLGSFSVAGVMAVEAIGFDSNPLLSIFLGTLTGVGGGALRDMMTGKMPYIFRKHIYALAAASGSAIYYVGGHYLNAHEIAAFVGMFAVFIIRILAAHYCWSLPRIHIPETPDDQKM
jgi:uncharacterized membrane protein YeiH